MSLIVDVAVRVGVPLRVELKGRQDFVSAADRAVEALIAERLAAAFPPDFPLGEETHRARPPGTEGLLWVVDPIDGTANFARGRPDWCVSIGVLAAGCPTVGVINVPAVDELFAAVGLRHPVVIDFFEPLRYEGDQERDIVMQSRHFRAPSPSDRAAAENDPPNGSG